MFDALGDKLQAVLGGLRSRGVLDEETISTAMREIRLALLEADSPESVQSALEKAGNKPVLLLVSRRGQTIYMTVKP